MYMRIIKNERTDVPSEKEVSTILDHGYELEIYASNGNIYVECITP